MPNLSINEIFDGISVGQFISEYFQRKPLCRSGIKQLITYWSLSDFENFLWDHEASIASQLTAIRGDMTRPLPDRSGREFFRWAIDEVRDGSLLSFSDVHLFQQRFSSIVAEITMQLTANVSSVTELWHSSVQDRDLGGQADIFVLQTFGSSTWDIWNGSEVASNASRFTYKLSPGDFLYIPKGFERQGSALHGYNLFVAFSFVPVTQRDYLEFLVEVAAEEEDSARKGLSIVNVNTQILATAREAVGLRSQMPRVQRMAAERLELNRVCKLRPAPGHHLEAIFSSHSLNLETRVSLPDQMTYVLMERGESVHLYIPGLGIVDERRTEPGGLVFPVSATNLLRNIMSMKEPFTASMLPGIYSSRTRVAVLQRLAWEGALRIH